LPKDRFMPYMKESLDFIENNLDDNDPTKFSQLEFEKFRRVVDYMQITQYPEEKIQQGRRDFYNWFNELDHRRGTNFLETFLEMADFYHLCESTNEQ